MRVRTPILAVAAILLVVTVCLGMAFCSALLAFLIGLAVYDRIPSEWLEILNKRI